MHKSMLNEDQDAADIERLLAGDQGGFEAIVRRWQHRLVSLAWRFCRDRALAEDMAQEVFLKVYRSVSSFRGESSFATWLISVALNTYRTRVRMEGRALASIDSARLPSKGSNPLRKLEVQRRAETVRRAVLALPDHYRDAIIMYYFEEKNLGEASRVLAVPEGTLKARLHRARELLRQRCAHLELPDHEIAENQS